MEHILRPIYQERASDSNTLGAILMEKVDELSPTTDNIDSILLILVAEAERPVFTKHYTYGEKNAAMHIVTEKQLRKWLLLGTNKKLINWLVDGRVLFDRNEYVYKLRQEMRNNPRYGRNIKMGIEFAKLLRRYQESKVSFDQLDYLDSNVQMLETLNHLARLSIIEEGVYPELKVWEQVRLYNVDVYQLYERFVIGSGSLQQKLQAVFETTATLIRSKVEESSRHIVSVMTKQEKWSIQELHEQEELKDYSVNLEVFIEYLIDKGYIDIERVSTKSEDVYHRYYKV
ncbi:MAG: hypothetical protein KBT36_16720 [Kurthia sp.]|nr:hypothetical protein [Candidatus Kurthia equi]